MFGPLKEEVGRNAFALQVLDDRLSSPDGVVHVLILICILNIMNVSIRQHFSASLGVCPSKALLG
jgi:hypothetical protein